MSVKLAMEVHRLRQELDALRTRVARVEQLLTEPDAAGGEEPDQSAANTTRRSSAKRGNSGKANRN